MRSHLGVMSIYLLSYHMLNGIGFSDHSRSRTTNLSSSAMASQFLTTPTTPTTTGCQSYRAIPMRDMSSLRLHENQLNSAVCQRTSSLGALPASQSATGLSCNTLLSFQHKVQHTFAARRANRTSACEFALLSTTIGHRKMTGSTINATQAPHLT